MLGPFFARRGRRILRAITGEDRDGSPDELSQAMSKPVRLTTTFADQHVVRSGRSAVRADIDAFRRNAQRDLRLASEASRCSSQAIS